MSRIDDILVKVRDSLADEDKSRWSDERLIRLIDEAQKKIATKAKLIRKYTYISVLADKVEYTLPDDVFMVTRVVNQEGTKIDVQTHASIDDMMRNIQWHDPYNTSYRRRYNSTSLSTEWENDTGSAVEFVLYDKQNPQELKIYPILNNVDGGETFQTSDYGVVTDITDDVLSSPYGVVVDVSNSASQQSSFNSPYGVVTDMESRLDYLKVYYYAKPSTISKTTDTLVIDDKWDLAIEYYVVGMALHDDQDTQNRTISADKLAMYTQEFTEAKEVSSKDNYARSEYTTSYNPEI